MSASDRVFRVDFYPQDWLIGTSRLTLEQRGVYIQIVAMIYANGGAIENDMSWIAGLCGCSSRKVKSLVDNLVSSGFLQLSDGKISQKRAESELNKKRTHLENSARGGRTKAENESEFKESKDLTSSEEVTHNLPLIHSSPEEELKIQDSVPTATGARDRGGGGAEDRTGGSGREGLGSAGDALAGPKLPCFDVLRFLKPAEEAAARRAAGRLDFQAIVLDYGQRIASGTLQMPDNLGAAFRRWCEVCAENERNKR